MDANEQPTHSCWCGNARLQKFSDDYLLCENCQTLVVAQVPVRATPEVKDDDHDFYGRQYWFKHQVTDLGYPDIKTRARTDLPGRGLHWLRTLLKYRLPPAKVLELGSAHMTGFGTLTPEAGEFQARAGS